MKRFIQKHWYALLIPFYLIPFIFRITAWEYWLFLNIVLLITLAIEVHTNQDDVQRAKIHALEDENERIKNEAHFRITLLEEELNENKN